MGRREEGRRMEDQVARVYNTGRSMHRQRRAISMKGQRTGEEWRVAGVWVIDTSSCSLVIDSTTLSYSSSL